MRRILLLSFFIPSLAAANPDQIATQASPVPDLKMLTTEPVERSESSGYGWREDPIRKRQKFHHGTDYRGDRGTPVLAAGNGTVIYSQRRGGYGKVVFIDHGSGVVTRYAHLSRIEVKDGQVVTAGDRIGRIGSTGRTTGPHLHFEVRLFGRSVDPNTALVVAEIMRQNPEAGQLAAFALSPELQAQAHDAESRPERKAAPKRDRTLW
jgi:murein DD-endopeptidase MepM/ murein hydrolase activator NlpD